MFEEKSTEGMPDMMPKGTVDNPPQKQPQDIAERMDEQPYGKKNPERDNNISTEDDIEIVDCGC